MQCLSIQKLGDKPLYYIRNEAGWSFVLVQPGKEILLAGLGKMLPLKINIADYGKIIREGSGLNPPRNIAIQMQRADFSKAGNGSQIYYLLSHDKNHQDFYTYLDVPYYLDRPFIEARDSGKAFEFTDYGEILASGWGEANEEVKSLMKNRHGIDTP